jgi:hypothetical protein
MTVKCWFGLPKSLLEIVASKGALSALGKRRMKNVDKNIDENNKPWVGKRVIMP